MECVDKRLSSSICTFISQATPYRSDITAAVWEEPLLWERFVTGEWVAKREPIIERLSGAVAPKSKLLKALQDGRGAFTKKQLVYMGELRDSE